MYRTFVPLVVIAFGFSPGSLPADETDSSKVPFIAVTAEGQSIRLDIGSPAGLAIITVRKVVYQPDRDRFKIRDLLYRPDTDKFQARHPIYRPELDKFYLRDLRFKPVDLQGKSVQKLKPAGMFVTSNTYGAQSNNESSSLQVSIARSERRDTRCIPRKGRS